MVEMNENAAEVEKFVNMWKPIANSIAVNKVKYLAGTQPKQKITEAFACPQVWQRLNVCWDGEVRMCCGDWQGKFVLGNAKETSIRELWHGVKYNAVRSAHGNGEYDKFAVCAGCEVNKR